MRRFQTFGIVLLAALTGTIGPALADNFSLPLTVKEPAGVDRLAAAISGGIPLPAGQFKRDQAFALFRAGGKEIPCQTVPLVVNSDGTLRWVLVDFQDDLAAGGTNKYTLKAVAPQVRPRAGLKVAQTANAVTIDTGKVTLAISKTAPFSLFSAAAAHGRPVILGGQVTYTDGFDGKTYVAARPTSIELENAGPLRVTVKVVGRFVGDDRTMMRYIARITAWAGQSRVHVKYSLANSNPEHYCWRMVSRSVIEMRLAGQPKGTIVGAAKPIEAGAEGALAQGLNAKAKGSAKVIDGEKEVWASAGGEERAEGWLAAKVGDGAVLAADLYFADNPPRRLAVSKGSLVVTGVMERWDSEEEGAQPTTGKARPLPDCTHLSSEYLIDFAAPVDGARLSAECQAAREAVHCLAAPAWYLQDTEALVNGKFCTQANEVACYDAWGWKYDEKDIPSEPRIRYTRFINGPGDAHYDPEEDVIDQLVLMYLRTGARPYFASARSWANYCMDIYCWRSDGWRWKDGGVWWGGGPKGNDPQRSADPVSGWRNSILGPASKEITAPWTKQTAGDLFRLVQNKGCNCHNWAYGMMEWYCLTGDHDALEAATDRVEEDYDAHSRAIYLKDEPGKQNYFRRSFSRSALNANALRMVLPDDPYARQASEYLFQAYMKRPTREPRGLVNAAGTGKVDLERFVGQQGLAALAESGNIFDSNTGQMTDPRTGKTWFVNVAPHTWMFPPMSQAMELYYRLTGDEDAMDWTIAYAQAAARVLYQSHGLLTYDRLLVDFPRRGVCRDLASWTLPPGATYAEHMKMSGFLARFHPDVCARGYSLCGDAFLKQRAFDYWNAGSHRDYQTMKMSPMDRVGQWMNYVSDHDGELDFVGRTFYIWAHPRKDDKAPQAVSDLKVVVSGDKATVNFTAPADKGDGKVVRYQVKCSDKPIVGYEVFLNLYNNFQDDTACNWWMAANVMGEPGPGSAGQRESFEVSGVPAGAKYFAVCSFDYSSNRSEISNLAEVKR